MSRTIPKAVLAAAGVMRVEQQDRLEAAGFVARAVQRTGGRLSKGMRAFLMAGGCIAGAMGPEVKFVGSLPAVTANTTQQLQISGVLPDGYELRGLIVDVNATFKSAAGAFAIAAADHNTIMNAIISRVRMRAWGIDNAYSLTAPEARSIAVYMQAADPFTSDPRLVVGRSMQATGGVAEQTHISWPIWFTKRGIDFPEIFSPSTNQFNVPGHTLAVQLGAGGTGIVLAGGTANFTVASIDVYCVIAPAQIVHFGPPMMWEQVQITQNPYPTDGYFLDGFLADERDSYTVFGQATQIVITRDDRVSPANIPPPILAQRFLDDSETIDANRPYNITANALGGAGSVLTPYSWLDGAARATEWQYPITKRNRSIYQILAAGGSAAATLLNWKVLPVARAFDELVKTCTRHNLRITSVDDLEVRGGGGADNDVLSDFKGRRLAQKRVINPKAKAA
jgi:hypothetical protein